MAYSGSIAEWDVGTAYIATDQVGWEGQIWEATTGSTGSEPSTTNTDWALQTPVALSGLSFEEEQLDADENQTLQVSGITVEEVNVPMPPHIYLSGVSIEEVEPTLETSNLLGFSLGLVPEKTTFFEGETSNLLGFSLGLVSEPIDFFPSETSNLLGFSLGFTTVKLISCRTSYYKKLS